MRKIIGIFLVIAFLNAITGCAYPSNTPETSAELDHADTTVPDATESKPNGETQHLIMLEDLSDSSADLDLSGLKRYDIRNDKQYEEYVPPAQRDFQYNGKVYTGTLNEGRVRWTGYIPEYEYVVDGVVSFWYNAEGTLTEFSFWRRAWEQFEKVADTRDECIEVAKSFVSDYIDVEQYEMYVTNDDDDPENSVTIKFQKYIDGILTFDYAVIFFEKGVMEAFFGYMLNSIPNGSSNPYDFNVALQTVYATLDKCFALLVEAGCDVTYKEPAFFLRMTKDGDLALVCDIAIACRYPDEDPLGNYFESGVALRFVLLEATSDA